MTKGTVAATTVLNNLHPRVALVGPKGSGKSIHRLFVAHGFDRLPTPLTEVLRSPQAAWCTDGAVEYAARPSDPTNWESNELGTVSLVPPRVGNDQTLRSYLPKVQPTGALTVHRLALPSADADAAAVEVLDFPGEWWSMSASHDSGIAKRVITLLTGCRVIVLMLPYWALLPSACLRKGDLRTIIETQLDNGKGNGNGSDTKEGGLDRAYREGVFRHTREWLLRLHPVVSSRDGPSLLVCLTMLGSDWQQDVKAPDKNEEFLTRVHERLTEIRSIIRHPLCNGPATLDSGRLADGFGLLEEIRQRLASTWHAACARKILARLHDEVAQLVAIAHAHTGQGDPTREVIAGLHDLVLAAGKSRVRYLAMNVVSENHVLFDKTRQPPDRITHLALDPAGAILPTLYLCAFADRLR